MVATTLFDYLFWLIYIAIFVASLYALVDAARTPAQAFVAMDKQTKQLWLILLGVSAVVSLGAVMTPYTLFTFLALVPTLIYLLDVRPAVRGIGRDSGPW